MFILTRTITSWRSLAVLAGLLMVMATNVASAAPRHGRRIQPPPVPQQCAVCVEHGTQRCSVHAPALTRNMNYRRGFAAGKQAGQQAGYKAGLNGRPYAGHPTQPLRRRHVQFKVGFKAGYTQAYDQGYRQGRAVSRARPRCGLSGGTLRLNWDW